jgi:hypothetical protein
LIDSGDEESTFPLDSNSTEKGFSAFVFGPGPGENGGKKREQPNEGGDNDDLVALRSRGKSIIEVGVVELNK